ncbi:hypothetical protein [Mycobacterium sp.]|uniref:hypothetical protein n=1 Tax=Mycobacterium sp. TaxID=1785 RepID=UPI003CA1849B
MSTATSVSTAINGRREIRRVTVMRVEAGAFGLGGGGVRGRSTTLAGGEPRA